MIECDTIVGEALHHLYETKNVWEMETAGSPSHKGWAAVFDWTEEDVRRAAAETAALICLVGEDELQASAADYPAYVTVWGHEIPEYTQYILIKIKGDTFSTEFHHSFDDVEAVLRNLEDVQQCEHCGDVLTDGEECFCFVAQGQMQREATTLRSIVR